MSNPKYVSWLTNGAACSICRANELEGVVPWGHVFSSGDTAPPAHDHCNCGLQSEDPDYDARVDSGEEDEDDERKDGDENNSTADGENQPANDTPRRWRYPR